MTVQYTGRDLTLLLSHARTVGLSLTISSDCDRLAFWRTLTRVLTKPATLTPTPLGKMDYNADKRARKPPRTFRKDLLRGQWGTCLQGFRAGEAKPSEKARTWVCSSGESLYRPWPYCAGDKSTSGGDRLPTWTERLVQVNLTLPMLT